MKSKQKILEMIDFAHKDRELQRQQKQDDGYARGVIWALEWVQKE